MLERLFYNLNMSFEYDVKLLKQFDHDVKEECANIALMHDKEVRKYLRKIKPVKP